MRYVYTTNVENQDEIVRFDTVDSPFLPIVQRLGRVLADAAPDRQGSGGRRQRARGAVVRAAAERRALRSVPALRRARTRSEHKFTPLVATLRFNPYQSMTVDANATFGNISHQVDSISLSANLVGTGTRADKYLGFTYFASFDTPGLDNGRSQIRLNTGSFARARPHPRGRAAQLRRDRGAVPRAALPHRLDGLVLWYRARVPPLRLFGGPEDEEQRTATASA